MIRYDKYKDSGIEWIGEIPEHWVVTKNKFLFKSLNTKRIPLSAEERGVMEKKLYDYYGASGVIDQVEDYLFDEELILIGEDGANLLTRSKRLAFIAKGKYWVNNHAHILKPINGDIRYLCELLDLNDYTIYVSGSAQPKLTQEALMYIPNIQPPLAEQTAIATYLECQTAQIDALIGKKERLIELLNEERTAIINQAVTKGLNPNVPMKPSGIEWLGEIPEHWDRLRLKSLVSTKVCDGPHETPDWQTNGIPFISAEAIKGNSIDFEYKRGYITTEQHAEYCKKTKVLKGDILFCKSGSTTGKSAIVESEIDFGIWSPLAVIRANDRIVNNYYLFQSIQSSSFRYQVETSWSFGTQPNIGMGALENLWVAVPPIAEQMEIVRKLQVEFEKFEMIFQKLSTEITLLQEYKTALISEVVTGKVKVVDEGN